MTQYILDTRTTYQRIRDWLCSLFYSKHKKQEIQVARVLSSYERENRLRLRKNHYPDHSPILTPPTPPSSPTSNFPPIVPTHDSREESVKTCRKRRAYRSPPETVAGKNNLIRCHFCSGDIARSNRNFPVCHEPLPWPGMEMMRD